MKTYGIRPLVVSLSLLLTFGVARAVVGCDAHPGFPHDEWMKWVDNMNAKNAAAKAAGGGSSGEVTKLVDAQSAPPAIGKRSYADGGPQKSNDDVVYPKKSAGPLFRSMSDMSSGR